jgi:hypothetical protein
VSDLNIIFEIGSIGWKLENLRINYLFDLNTSRNYCFNIHQFCLNWSTGLIVVNDSLILNADKIACESLVKVCSICKNYGASIECSNSECDQIFHYPCLTSTGSAYLDLKTKQAFCSIHSSNPIIKCILCNESSESLSSESFIYCSNCGCYFHAQCLSIELNSFIRAGWQCVQCKTCLTCKQPFNNNSTSETTTNMLTCDTCNKCIHLNCLKQDQLTNNNNNNASSKWQCMDCLSATQLISKHCSGCSQLFVSKVNESLCYECDLDNLKKACNSANCSVCGQYIHIIEQKKRIRNCITCLKYVHVSCDKYYGSDKLDNYVCISCRDKDNGNYVSPVLDKVGFKISYLDFLQKFI